MTPVPINSPPELIRIDGGGADPVVDYMREMSRVCPFIEPSVKAGCLYASHVTLDCQAAQEIHPRMFEQIIPAIERYREHRRTLPDKNHRLLICHTLFFQLPPSLDAEANRLMVWPNWLGFLLKQLYTPKAIVFGFVRKNIAESSSTGEPIPACSSHAVVIRSRVIGADHRFFTGNQDFLSALSEAVDDGGDVHKGLLPHVPNLSDPAALRADDYFHRLRVWGQSKLGK